MSAELERTIASVAARCLRTGGPIDPDIPLDMLGLDSLATIELAAALEAELGCTLPPDIVADSPSARSLAARLTASGAYARAADDPFELMLADAVLPEDVRLSAAVRRGTDFRSARTILLTGATGFLGGALLRELLARTSARVICLTRGGRGTGDLPEGLAARVEIVAGDLSKPLLGLSRAEFDRLSREADSICHCGAIVNWVFSYPSLRAANVLGTLELLRLACQGRIPFHFISSLSVCYSTEGPRHADETFDALPHLRGVQLGYAQSKIVAEALVRTAGQRGLPIRIYRPALISGHSVSGAFNRDDLISALVRGCVHMKTAPDLDWKLDCEPVDVVASAIVQLSSSRGPVFHLGHERPRHWRECVLWLRMYGYDVRLVSYPAWLRQLERETRHAGDSAHPLRPLRSFFLDRASNARGLTLPELYEESRRTRARSDATRRMVRVRNVPLDAGLLDTYVGAFRSAGALDAPPRPEPRPQEPQDPGTHGPMDPGTQLASLLNRPVSRIDVLGSGSDHSIVSELTAWRSGRSVGLFRARLYSPGRHRQDVLLKVKARDTDVMAVGQALADLVDTAVGSAYRPFADRIGFAASHRREIEIYRQTDARFLRHAPALLGSVADDAAEQWLAAIEYVTDAVVTDPAAALERWTAPHIERAVDGVASLHAIWLGREAELAAKDWIGHIPSSASLAEMSPLWTALADHAAPYFSAWSDPDLAGIHRRLVSRLDRWWPALEAGRRTLIHNDFNPRNLCLRGRDARLCAYDWELATVGAPQHDLAEFLCFVLPSDATRDDVLHWVERHRRALERESNTSIDAGLWRAGFEGALYDLLINRLSIYALVNRVRHQPFLPRVVRTWRHLYQLFPLEASA